MLKYKCMHCGKEIIANLPDKGKTMVIDCPSCGAVNLKLIETIFPEVKGKKEWNFFENYKPQPSGSVVYYDCTNTFTGSSNIRISADTSTWS